MNLHIVLQVKFRAFFITFANYRKEWDLPIPVGFPGQTLIHFDRQGVKLDATVQ